MKNPWLADKMVKLVVKDVRLVYKVAELPDTALHTDNDSAIFPEVENHRSYDFALCSRLDTRVSTIFALQCTVSKEGMCVGGHDPTLFFGPSRRTRTAEANVDGLGVRDGHLAAVLRSKFTTEPVPCGVFYVKATPT